MEEIYQANQAEVLFDVWPKQAEWFIVGGTADANEAQTVKARFPCIQCLGFEPNPELYDRQLRLGFPGTLLKHALWSRHEELTLSVPALAGPRSGSVCVSPDARPDLEPQETSRQFSVQGMTLDNASLLHGPFTNAVLWLDIEHAELEALKGARGLLEDGRILLVNLETFVDLLPRIVEYLKPFELEYLRSWNVRSLPGGVEWMDAVFLGKFLYPARGRKYHDR